MPPPKKAAKKAAKKAPKKHAPHHEAGKDRKDLRRSFEHMGCVDILERIHPTIGSGGTRILAGLAVSELHAGRPRHAADLLRAAEHWVFATFASEYAELAQIGPDLTAAIAEQFEDLIRRADEHWDDGESASNAVAPIYESARKKAFKANQSANYFQALEFARAAEALAHAKNHGPHKLEHGETIDRLNWKLAD